MGDLNLQNPVFAAYAVAASLMILKAIGMSWLTVVRMVKVGGGFRSPEDVKKTPLNPNPSPDQVAPNEYVDRVRRIHLNDLENIPFFLAAGLLFVLIDPGLTEARIAFYGYVISRFVHFAAYLSARTHDTRAILWTIGSLILVYMTVRVLLAALGVYP
jgi:glutathione S-transferase